MDFQQTILDNAHGVYFQNLFDLVPEIRKSTRGV